MGDGTKENKPLKREDVLRLIQENGDKAEGLDLSGKEFADGIDLSRLDLQGIILIGSMLRGAHLKEVNLRDANLEGAFLAGANLEEASLTDANLEEAILMDANLKGAFLMFVHLKGAFLGGAHLKETFLGGAYLEGVDLRGAQFFPETRLEEAGWGSFILGEESDRSFGVAAATYRRLKMWYTEHGLYDVAGKFFYREMEAKRKAQSWKEKPHLKLWSWVMRLLCGYGEKPERTVISALVIIISLAIAYRLWGSFNTSSIWDILYYSAVSFISLGYGNWAPQPTGWAKSMGVLEAFVGFFMMTLLLVTFVRKMTR